MFRRWLLRHSVLFIFPVFLTGLSACRRNTDQPLPKTILVSLVLKDDSGRAVNDAQCYLLENKEDYTASLHALKAEGKILDSAISQNGIATFRINPRGTYYLFIRYYDNSRELILINDKYENIINQLPKNTNITAEVTLIPADANVAFYVLEGNPLPIRLFFENDTLLISEARQTPPTSVRDAGVVTKNLRPGRYKVQAQNSVGCLWTYEFTLPRGGFQPLLFSSCDRTRIVFWTNDENQEQLPIVVISSKNDTLAILTQTQATYSCDAAAPSGGGQFFLEQGFHTYAAKGKTCVWTGSIQATASGCNAIFLEPCER